LKYRKPDDPVTVYDHRPERERLLKRSNLSPAEMAQAFEEGQWERPPGPLRHSAPWVFLGQRR
jgi:hypothetical protein